MYFGVMCELLQPLCCAPNQDPSGCVCSPCLPKLQDAIDYAFKLSGGMGMFFSFTEVSVNLFLFDSVEIGETHNNQSVESDCESPVAIAAWYSFLHVRVVVV